MTSNIGRLVTQSQAGLGAILDSVEKPLEGHVLSVRDFDQLRFAFEDDGYHVGYLWDVCSLTTELEVTRDSVVVQFALGDSHDPKSRNTDSHLRPTESAILTIEAREN